VAMLRLRLGLRLRLMPGCRKRGAGEWGCSQWEEGESSCCCMGSRANFVA
jgi:hypothetical protein